MESNPPIPTEERARGHEFRDIRLRPILLLATALLGLIVIAHVLGWGSLRWLRQTEAPAVTQEQSVGEMMSTPPPEPRLEPEPSHPFIGAQDLTEVRAREAALLGDQNTGWADSAHHFRKIPLQSAIDLSVAQGLPLVLPATMPSQGPFMPASSARHGPGGIP
jgi:hypothetical protein